MNNTNKKPRIAVFDLTDCEGCELQFLAKEAELENILKQVEFCNIRLLSEEKEIDNIDVSFIEGTPLTQEDIDILYTIREKSKKVIAFGTCAATGGIASGLNVNDRSKLAKCIYGKNYKLKIKEALPLSSYIKIDFVIPGCPVDPLFLKDSLLKILNIGWIVAEDFPVCQECKGNGNDCLLKKGEFCLGPITSAGCGAPCPSAKFGCLGCMDILKDANLTQFRRALKNKKITNERINQLYDFYLKNNETIQKTK